MKKYKMMRYKDIPKKLKKKVVGLDGKKLSCLEKHPDDRVVIEYGDD